MQELFFENHTNVIQTSCDVMSHTVSGSIRLRHGPKCNEIMSNFRTWAAWVWIHTISLNEFVAGMNCHWWQYLFHFLNKWDHTLNRAWGSYTMTEWGSNIAPLAKVGRNTQRLLHFSSRWWLMILFWVTGTFSKLMMLSMKRNIFRHYASVVCFPLVSFWLLG